MPTPAVAGVDDFVLQDFRGKQHRLADYAEAEAVAVAFLGTQCPLAKLYGLCPRLPFGRRQRGCVGDATKSAPSQIWARQAPGQFIAIIE
ncbi:MAG TPA: hypothetical protein VMV10_22775 [Pirellulales bacterium]|nr:hypothetical protein [Pirellulales bacterium]